jgi:RNase H-fold protein (predicted Holliday junction resolvase)
MVILGLDVSTTTIGYAFTKNKKILDMGFIDIKKQTSIQEKAYYAMDILESKEYEIDKIQIEDNLSGFQGGRTSQQVIIKLAKFNAVFCFILENSMEVEVTSINPNTARKKVFGKARVKGVKAKDYVKSKIDEMYDTKKWCKTTSRGNFDSRNIDSYDALVMSLCD